MNAKSALPRNNKWPVNWNLRTSQILDSVEFSHLYLCRELAR
jgi:hypothetical protein